MEVNDLLGMLVSAVISAVIGAGAAVIAFREKLTLAARDQKHAKEIAELKAEQLDTRLTDYERRQLVMLELVVDIARKLGINHRFTDLLKDPDKE